ncbi:MAG: GIY-YIG nuclease family protein [Clostridiales bacterium]|nr:GIY-YIG nuclease family protein [Clostridiales bacterium]
MDRKKELKEWYKQMKPDMGIFIIRCKENNKCYIQATHDLKGVMNGAKMKLGANMHPCRELQKEWNQFGEGNFTIEILEKLEYDKDDSKTDYKDELALMHMIWEEKLQKEALEFYNK